MVEMAMSTEQVRPMTTDDLAAATVLSTAAGWNQTTEDWRMLMELQPRNCFAIKADGHLVSTTTLLCYSQRLAWIGMVLTSANYRGQGFARRLLAAALDHADSLGIETVKLDATDAGKPIYEQFGFKSEQPVERWSRIGSGQSHTLERQGSSHFSGLSPHLHALDLQGFGTDRLNILQALSQRSTMELTADAFLFSRPGRTTHYLGPCIADDPAEARKIISSVLNASGRSSWSWDLLPANQQAVALAAELGFTKQRRLTRMARGKPLRARDEMIFAIAGFELG
jgi:RimJ/RimL family protein N-acetyltransferase